jgi:hypothetical protein
MLLPSPNILVLKVIGAVAVAAAIFAAGDWLGSTRVENAWLREKVKAEEANIERALAAQGVANAYELRIKDLEFTARSQPARVVRLCPQVPVPGTAGGTDGTGADGSDRANGPDIGPRLRDYSIEFRKCAEQLNALQEWLRTVANTKG